MIIILNVSPVAALKNKAIQDSINYKAWYDKNDTTVPCSTGGTTTVLTGSQNTEKVYNFLIGKGLKDFQAAGFMGNLVAESGINPRRVQNTPTPSGDRDTMAVDGVTGYGIAQWTSIGRQRNLHDAALKAGTIDGDLTVQLDYLWTEVSGAYKSSTLIPLQQSTSIESAVDIVMRNFEAPADPIGDLIIRIPIARGILALYGGTTPPQTPGATPVVSAGVCGGGGSNGSAVTGSIVQTALNYAWETGGHGPNKSDAKPSYQTAEPQFNGSTGTTEFSDCGVFTSTVMIASGVDTNYPKRGTLVQMPYLANSKNYVSVNTTNTADLHPGDIFINSVHTYIYIGPQPGGYSAVSASLGGHVPQNSGLAYFFQDGATGEQFKIYRFVGGAP